MGVLAKKSKKIMVYRIAGIIICLLVLIPTVKTAISPNDRQKIFAVVAGAIEVLLIIGLGVGVIFDLLRPDNLVKRDGDTLFLYCKGKWYGLNFSEIINIRFRNNQSDRIIHSFGTLIIETAEKTYRIESVENVALAWSEIMNICGKQKANR